MFDDALDALGSAPRRRVLFALLAETSRSDAAIVPEAADDGSRGTPSLAAHHVHLPKLADYGFIEWDPGSSEVRRGPNFGEIRPLLELLRDHAGEPPEGWVQPAGTTAWRPVDAGPEAGCGTD